MGSNGATLHFGVELELLLGGHKKPFTSWKALAEDISRRLLKAGVPNHVRHGKTKTPETYREWSIVQEVTIPSQPSEGLYGIELVSPVYPAAWNWGADLTTIYTTVHAAYVVVPSPHCSTHVHVSTTPVPLPERAVVLLAEAALYFEPALDALMPASRRASSTYWCRSNRESHMFKAYMTDAGAASGTSGESGSLGALGASGAVIGEMLPLSAETARSDLAGCLGVVRYGYDAAAFSVPEAMNLLPANSAYGRAHGKKHSFVHGKVFKWNFSGLRADAHADIGTDTGASTDTSFLGTIEFRQPPGSTIADEACMWVTLALAFVSGVMIGDDSLTNPHQGASLDELWQVLQTGAVDLGWESLGAVEELFRGSSSGEDY